jgi:hypothetical protein
MPKLGKEKKKHTPSGPAAAAASLRPSKGAKNSFGSDGLVSAAAGSTKAGAKDGKSKTSGIVFNKDFGQHILRNPLVSQAIVDKVSFSENKRILAPSAVARFGGGFLVFPCFLCLVAST